MYKCKNLQKRSQYSSPAKKGEPNIMIVTGNDKNSLPFVYVARGNSSSADTSPPLRKKGLFNFSGMY